MARNVKYETWLLDNEINAGSALTSPVSVFNSHTLQVAHGNEQLPSALHRCLASFASLF